MCLNAGLSQRLLVRFISFRAAIIKPFADFFKSNDPAQRDLQERQVFGFDTQAEYGRTEIVNRIHILKFDRHECLWRA